MWSEGCLSFPSEAKVCFNWRQMYNGQFHQASAGKRRSQKLVEGLRVGLCLTIACMLYILIDYIIRHQLTRQKQLLLKFERTGVLGKVEGSSPHHLQEVQARKAMHLSSTLINSTFSKTQIQINLPCLGCRCIPCLTFSFFYLEDVKASVLSDDKISVSSFLLFLIARTCFQ